MRLIDLQIKARFGIGGYLSIGVMIIGSIAILTGQFAYGGGLLILGWILFILNVMEKVLGLYIDHSLEQQEEIINRLSKLEDR